MNERELRNCLGRFATGVTVVTCRTENGPHGLTVNAFSSVSLEPPLVLVSIDRKANACAYLESSPFTVNVLDADQQTIAMHFAGKPQRELSVDWVDGRLAPRIAGALAWLECSPWRMYDGGDHVLYVGRVEDFRFYDGDALGFYCGAFHRVPSPVEKEEPERVG